MFHAVGLPWGAAGERLRDVVSDYITANAGAPLHGQPVSDWIAWEHSLGVDEYVGRLRGRMWGGALELTLLASFLRLPIFVYAPTPGDPSTCTRIADVRPDPTMPRTTRQDLDTSRLPAFVCLLYVGRSHYMHLLARRDV